MKSTRKKRVLITGGAGFIGTHTARALRKEGYEVCILDSMDPQVHGVSSVAVLPPESGVIYRRGDVRRSDDLEEVLDGVEIIHHFAAHTGVGQSMYAYRPYVDTNVGGTATLLEAIIKRQGQIRRVILASSRAVYGEGNSQCELCGVVPPLERSRSDLEQGEFRPRCSRCRLPLRPISTDEEMKRAPVSVYGWTKSAQEDLCLLAAKTYGLPITILRYFNVYGSGQSLQNPYTGIIPIFYSRIQSGRPITLYEQGLPIRDFIHIEDVVRANVLSAQADLAPGTVLNIGSGQSISISGLAEILCDILGKGEVEVTSSYRMGDIFGCVAEISRASELLGFRAKKTMEQGLREFVEWAASEQAADLQDESAQKLRQFNLFGNGQQTGPRLGAQNLR